MLNTHKLRMQAKAIARERRYQNQGRPEYIPANLGVNHPDYGMSVEDHEAEKALRNTQKSS